MVRLGPDQTLSTLLLLGQSTRNAREGYEAVDAHGVCERHGKPDGGGSRSTCIRDADGHCDFC